jgi:hypothetical protein
MPTMASVQYALMKMAWRAGIFGERGNLERELISYGLGMQERVLLRKTRCARDCDMGWIGGARDDNVRGLGGIRKVMEGLGGVFGWMLQVYGVESHVP